MKYIPAIDISPQQRTYDREVPDEYEDEDLDEEELEHRAIIRAIKRGKQIPEDFD